MYMEEYGRLYQQMHANAKHFQGISILPYAEEIGKLIGKHAAMRVLDYGCGKGHQYLVHRIHEEWPCGRMPICYDPGVLGLATHPPSYAFEAVICTDVLEHIGEYDIPAIVNRLVASIMPSAFDPFIYITVSCREANKTLPDGRNVHLTVKDPDWWWNGLQQRIPNSIRLYLRCELAKDTSGNMEIRAFDRGDKRGVA